MNNRGGRRRGAGRPLGSKNRRTAEIARAAAESGFTPIEVMLGTMRELWDQGTPEAKLQAAEIAKDAAPYIHPRLASIDQTGPTLCRPARGMLERGRVGSEICTKSPGS